MAGHTENPFLTGAGSAERNRLTGRWSDGWVCFLLLCLISVLACMMYGFAVQKASPSIAVEDRINPNTASLGSLIRLEGIIIDEDAAEALKFLKRAVYNKIAKGQQDRLKSHLDTWGEPVEGFKRRNDS